MGSTTTPASSRSRRESSKHADTPSSIPRYSRPFSPSPPRETRHTASRPPSLMLGAPLLGAVVSPTNLNIAGLPATPKPYSPQYDGLPRSSSASDPFPAMSQRNEVDTFSVMSHGTQATDRSGNGEMHVKGDGFAEGEFSRGIFIPPRRRRRVWSMFHRQPRADARSDSVSTTSSASPPLGATSLLAALSGAVPKRNGDKSPRPSPQTYSSLGPELFPRATPPTKPHEASARFTPSPTSSTPSRSLYDHASPSVSRSMPRLHQPTVVRAPSGRGLSFLPPPPRLSSSSLVFPPTPPGDHSSHCTPSRSNNSFANLYEEDIARSPPDRGRPRSSTFGHSRSPTFSSLDDASVLNRGVTEFWSAQQAERKDASSQLPGEDDDEDSPEAELEDEMGTGDTGADDVELDRVMQNRLIRVSSGIQSNGQHEVRYGGGPDMGDMRSNRSRIDDDDLASEVSSIAPNDIERFLQTAEKEELDNSSSSSSEAVIELGQSGREGESGDAADIGEPTSPSRHTPAEQRELPNEEPLYESDQYVEALIDDVKITPDEDEEEMRHFFTQNPHHVDTEGSAMLPESNKADPEGTGLSDRCPQPSLAVSTVELRSRPSDPSSSPQENDGEVSASSELSTDVNVVQPKVEHIEREKSSSSPYSPPAPEASRDLTGHRSSEFELVLDSTHATDEVDLSAHSAAQSSSTAPSKMSLEHRLDLHRDALPGLDLTPLANEDTRQDHKILDRAIEPPTTIKRILSAESVPEVIQDEAEAIQDEAEDTVAEDLAATSTAMASPGLDQVFTAHEDAAAAETEEAANASAKGTSSSQKIDQPVDEVKSGQKIGENQSEEKRDQSMMLSTESDAEPEPQLHEVPEPTLRNPAHLELEPQSSSDAALSSAPNASTYIPPYQPRKSAKTFPSPPELAALPNDKDNLSLTLQASLTRRHPTIYDSSRRLELHVAWLEEPRNWTWVPGRRYIPSWDLRLVSNDFPSAKGGAVVKSSQEAEAGAVLNRGEQQRGLVKTVLSSIPVVGRVANWVL